MPLGIPKELTWEFRKVHQFMVYAVNTPVQFAYAEYLKDPENYLNVASFYQKKRDMLLEELKDTPFKFTPASGSYFQLVDYTGFHQGNGVELVQKLVKENGVALIPLEPFYLKYKAPASVRICFAKTDDVLKSGIECLKKL